MKKRKFWGPAPAKNKEICLGNKGKNLAQLITSERGPGKQNLITVGLLGAARHVGVSFAQ